MKKTKTKKTMSKKYLTPEERTEAAGRYLRAQIELARKLYGKVADPEAAGQAPGTKKYSVLCPVHHVWAFEVYATDHEDALRVFKESDPTRLKHKPTHDVMDSSLNVLDPIEVRCESELQDKFEIDTGYFKFLGTQNGDPGEQEIDPTTEKPVPYWYLVEAGMPVSQLVCATSEAEARALAVDSNDWEPIDSKAVIHDDNIVGVDRQEKAAVGEYEEER